MCGRPGAATGTTVARSNKKPDIARAACAKVFRDRVRPSKSGREIEKFPRQFEPLRQMGSERFHTEGFGSVVAPENQIDTQFFGGDGGQMRRFAIFFSATR